MEQKHFENIKIIVNENNDMPITHCRSSVGIKYTVNGKIEGLFRGYEKPTLTVAEVVEAVNQMLNEILLCERKEQTMSREKQIEEIARVWCSDNPPSDCAMCGCRKSCYEISKSEMIYDAGYRKQSVGEWTYGYTGDCLDGTDASLDYKCSLCGKLATDPFSYRPHCGAKMSKGDMV